MKKVLVIGESCTDSFVYCKAVRLAPDLPVPVLQVVNEVTNPGMAANVLRNLISLGVNAELETNENWHEVLKTRYMHEDTNHMFLRVDSNFDPAPISALPDLSEYFAIVISDYNKGFLSEQRISEICQSHDLVFLDTKKPLNEWAKSAKFIKINDFEYKRSIASMGYEVREKVIHTLGGQGAEFQGMHFPVDKVEIKDSSGAGDSFMAALVAEYVNTSDIYKSIEFANRLASKVVTEKGVSVVKN